jgi:hypothetical protein
MLCELSSDDPVDSLSLCVSRVLFHCSMQGDGYGPPPPQSGMDPYGNYGSGPPPNWGHQ